ncbi:hypothetical protein C472_08244 [Halorubrum tebenquichense DSM 14210]|uniref:Uncharacterized protein n=1 Tax=Halorubrum tebenquichense DSM 14210 TaxID=1227485 RepID=M0DPK8_9EURY|nr:hypothetical protein C472_08244 [Halorubrum tebenquichense DSM 14210]
MEDFGPTVVLPRQFLNLVLDGRGHPVPLLEFDQGFVRERCELIVAEPVDLGFEFRLDDIVVEASLHQHVHVSISSSRPASVPTRPRSRNRLRTRLTVFR